MRVYCPHCRAKALVRSSQFQSDTVRELYCDCTNSKCLSRFVMSLSHKHDVQPPLEKMNGMLEEMLRNLPSEQRRALISAFNQ